MTAQAESPTARNKNRHRSGSPNPIRCEMSPGDRGIELQIPQQMDVFGGNAEGSDFLRTLSRARLRLNCD